MKTENNCTNDLARLEDFPLVTCLKCSWVSFGVSLAHATNEIESFNKYYETLKRMKTKTATCTDTPLALWYAPGSKLDALIAKEVMGFEVRTFRPSSDLIQAMMVVEKLNPLLFQIERENCCGVRYDCKLYNDPDCKDTVRSFSEISLPHAICLAALRFVRIKGIGDYR